MQPGAMLAKIVERDETMHGLLVKTSDGPRANPLTRIASRAASDMLRFAGEFGLTPVARARISRGLSWSPARVRTQ
jgi:phage terminase small subunit